MGMILFEEKDLEEIIQNTLDRFDDSNLKSESARKAISRKIMEGLKHQSETIEIDDQQFFSGHNN